MRPLIQSPVGGHLELNDVGCSTVWIVCYDRRRTDATLSRDPCMTRSDRIKLLATVLLIAAAHNATAQRAALEGVVHAEDGGAPVQFALVRLVHGDSSPVRDSPAQSLTSGTGRYRFDGLTPGIYRVQLLRIGFLPVVSEAVQVAAGELVQFAFRVASQTVVLPPVTVTAEVCVPAKELNEHPRTRTLWQQARDGAAVRTEFMARFRYDVQMREETVARKPDGSPIGAVDQKWVSDPKSAVQNAARTRAERLSRGYYGPTTKDGPSFHLPNELDVLHEDFLKEHCLVPAIQYGLGEIGLRFRPQRSRRNLLDVGGTIWLDSATFLARRIDLEYLDAEELRGTVRLDFSDVPVAGGMLRMPSGGEIDLRPSRTDPTRRTESTFTIRYAGFGEVRPR